MMGAKCGKIKVGNERNGNSVTAVNYALIDSELEYFLKNPEKSIK